MSNEKIYTEAEFNKLPVDKKTGCVKYANGDKEWYKEGKRHREDGPAIESTCGDKFWYKKDQLHREDGPAIEYAHGTKFWYKEGKFHREDGPAIELSNGTKEWYFDGERCSEEEYNVKMNKEKFYTKEEFDKLSVDNQTGCVKYADGDKHWYKEGKLHREDGPAVEFSDGDKHWYKEGKLHREDGPAVECDNGYKAWYKEDIRHREDGPAIEYSNGSKAWYLDGKACSEKEYKAKVSESNIVYTEEEFFKLPKDKQTGCVKYANGDKHWYKEGKCHREDGPAIEYANGYKEYWLEDKFFSEELFKQHCIINTIPTPIKDSIMNAPEKIWSVREFNELPTDERTGKFVFSSGTTSYYRKGQLHRTDGPAIIDGTYTAYFFNGIKFDSKESIDKLLNEARALPNQNETTNATSVPSGDVSGHYEAAVQIGRKEILAQEDAKFFAAVTAAGVAVTTASTSQSLVQMLKSDFTKASYRVGATQLTKITKNVIIKLLSNKNLDSERMKVIRELLDSELGSSFIATILGYTLTYAPKISDDPRAKVMANEFRVKGMEILGNEIVNVAITNLLPEIQSIITSLPKETVRLEQPSTEKEEGLSSEEEVAENIITNVVELKHHKVK